MFIGDFNNVTSNDEKWCGRTRNNCSFNKFRGFISYNELIDITYEGLPWTWCSSWDKGGVIKERLNRALASVKRVLDYENAKLTHLENHASNHNMLLLDLDPKVKRTKRRFFFGTWLQIPEIENVVRKACHQLVIGSKGCKVSKGFKVSKKIEECIWALPG